MPFWERYQLTAQTDLTFTCVEVGPVLLAGVWQTLGQQDLTRLATTTSPRRRRQERPLATSGRYAWRGRLAPSARGSR